MVEIDWSGMADGLESPRVPGKASGSRSGHGIGDYQHFVRILHFGRVS
jgi:hypothetical protein